MKFKTLVAVVLSLLLAVSCTRKNQEDKMKSQEIISENGVAIGGYDAVSYFSGQPVKGTEIYSTQWKNVKWLFSSEDHLNQFKKSPEKYSPQFGGNCSLAMSLGNASAGSPESWEVQDGKLYFHHGSLTKFFFHLIPGRLSSAETNWVKLKDQN